MTPARRPETAYTPPVPSDDSPSRLVYRPTVPDRGRTGEDPAPPAAPDAAALPETREGQIVSGRYRIEKLLGVGGMGCVYRAEHIHMRKAVAIKTLHPEMTQLPEAVARFEREAIAASHIDHPNIAAATDFGRLDDGSYFLVLQFVEGKSLRDTLDEGGPLPLDRALRITKQIASALRAAHALDIVHRDLKPDNVMLVPGEQGESVKVLDFGIAKVSIQGSGGLTRIGSVFGTPEYMSPEQCMGQPVDARSDLYALGTILYEMLSGRRPFHADDHVVLLRMQIMDPAPPLDPATPPEIAALVASLLAKSVDQRVASADDVIKAIDHWLEAAPGTTRQPPASAHGQPPTSRAAQPTVQPVSPPSAPFPQRSVSNALAPTHPRPAVLQHWRDLAATPVRLGTARVPLGVVAATGAVPVLLGIGGIIALVLVVRACSGPHTATPGTEPAAASVSSGQPTASSPAPAQDGERERAAREVERIEAIAVYKRSDDDWVTLAHSYADLARWEDAAKAYRSALSVRRSLSKAADVLQDLKRAGSDPAAFPIVVNLCETVLGRNGLDLMWILWQEARHDPNRADQADTLHKKLTILSRRASPQLRVAIELEATASCEKLAAILPRCVKDADARSVERLEELAKVVGCGDSGKQDCYPCLRADTSLARATERARSRPAPQLGQTPDQD